MRFRLLLAALCAGPILAQGGDPMVTGALHALAPSCDTEVGRCEAEAVEAALGRFETIPALAEIVAAVEGAPSDVVVAAGALGLAVLDDAGPGAPMPLAEWSALVVVWEGLSGGPAAAIAPLVVRLGAGGTDRDLAATIVGHPDPLASAAAARQVMSLGRLSGFATAREIATTTGEDEVIAAAVEAPMVLQGPTLEERAEVCPWALLEVSDERPRVALAGARLLAWCGGAYRESLVEVAEVWIGTDQVSSGLAGSLGMALDETASVEVAGRLGELLERIAGASALTPEVRGEALAVLADRRPDEATRRLLERYRRHREAELREPATAGLESLDRRSAEPAES